MCLIWFLFEALPFTESDKQSTVCPVSEYYLTQMLEKLGEKLNNVDISNKKCIFI